GTLDVSFVPQFSTYFYDVNTIKVLPDGKILIGAGSPAGIIKLNPDGSEDTSFGANSTTGTLIEGAVYDIEATNDNKLYVVGSFATYDGVNTRGIVRINEDGT